MGTKAPDIFSSPFSQLVTEQPHSRVGGIGISFRVNNTKVCFVGSHLAARDERVNARNANYTAIVNGLRLTNDEFDIANTYHVIFWLGNVILPSIAPALI